MDNHLNGLLTSEETVVEGVGGGGSGWGKGRPGGGGGGGGGGRNQHTSHIGKQAPRTIPLTGPPIVDPPPIVNSSSSSAPLSFITGPSRLTANSSTSIAGPASRSEQPERGGACPRSSGGSRGREGWSVGRYNWFGPGWKGDTGHIPHFERAGNSQYRGEGGMHEEVSEVWEEWGEGQRGKGSVSGNAPQKRGGLGRGGEERERGGVQAGRGCGAKGTQGRGGERGGGGNNRGLERGGGNTGIAHPLTGDPLGEDIQDWIRTSREESPSSGTSRKGSSGPLRRSGLSISATNFCPACRSTSQRYHSSSPFLSKLIDPDLASYESE